MSNDNIEKCFPDKQVVWEKKFDFPILEAYSRGDRAIVVIGNKPREIAILDNTGKEIMRKTYVGLNRVSISDDGNRILVSYEKEGYIPGSFIVQVDILDELGTKIGEIPKTYYPGLIISKDGKYSITTNVNGPGAPGRFEVFENETGCNIKLPIKYKYQHFYAQFLDKNKVIILLQGIEIIRDKKTKKRINSKKKPALFLIYNIYDNKIEVEKEILSINEQPFWLGIVYNELWVSPDGEHIAISGYNLSWESRSAPSPYTLLMMNKNGEILWEKTFEEEDNVYEGIKSAKFIDNENFLAFKFGINQSQLFLFDPNMRKEKWKYNLGPRYEGRLNNAYVNKDKNQIYVKLKKDIWKFDLNNGECKGKMKGFVCYELNNKYPMIIKGENNTFKLIK
ncbi:MAG: hypothetical protein K8R79_02750 [Calditrichales bacterium]|nr:hypothetical protein [Calditrichales bacterium]